MHFVSNSNTNVRYNKEEYIAIDVGKIKDQF